MRLKTSTLWLILALAAAGCATAIPAADPGFEAAIAQDSEFRRQQLARAGAAPIEEFAEHGLQVRRLLLRGFVPGQLPVMELHRASYGLVSLTLIHPGGRQESLPVPESAWEEMAALDDGVFERPAPLPPTSAPPHQTNCHGMSAYFEAADPGRVRSAGAMECPRAVTPFNPARRAAVEAFVRITLAARRCTRNGGEAVEWALSRCFSGSR